MLNIISAFFYKKTKILFIGILLILIVLMFPLLPVFGKAIHMNENMISLDSSKIYSPETIHAILTDWGDKGRIRQIWFHFTWDLVFPVLYFFFIGFLVSWFAKRGFRPGSKMQKMNLLAMVAAVDLLENISLLVLVIIYPVTSRILGIIKTSLTAIKYYLFGPVILAGLVTSVIFAIKNGFRIQE